MLKLLDDQFYEACNKLMRETSEQFREEDERAREVIDSILHAVTVKVALICGGSKKRARALTRNRRLKTPANRDSASYLNEEQLVADTLAQLQENLKGLDIVSTVSYEANVSFNIEEYVQHVSRTIERISMLLYSLNFASVVLQGASSSQAPLIERQIISAIRNHNNSVEIIAKIIPLDQLLSFRLGGKCLLLHFAAFCGNVEMVRYCLTLNDEQPLCAGMTPAFFAVSNSYLEVDHLTSVLDCLRQHSPNTYARACLGRSLVHQATIAGNLMALAFMKGNGADLNMRTANRKSSCVHLACRYGYTQVALWLVDIGGLNPFSVDCKSRSALYYGYLPADHRIHLVWQMSRRGILLPQQDMEALGWTGRVSKEVLSMSFQQSLLSIEEMSFMVFELQEVSEDDDLYDEGIEIEEAPAVVKSWGRRAGFRAKKKLTMGRRGALLEPQMPRSNTHTKTEEFAGVAVTSRSRAEPSSRVRNDSLIEFTNTFGEEPDEPQGSLMQKGALSPRVEERSFAWCLENRLEELEEFARTLYASENIQCWKAICLYELTPNEETCRDVYVPFLLADSPMLVNIRGREFSRLRKLLEESSYASLAVQHPDLFKNVKREITKVLQLNLYPCYKQAHGW